MDWSEERSTALHNAHARAHLIEGDHRPIRTRRLDLLLGEFEQVRHELRRRGGAAICNGCATQP